MKIKHCLVELDALTKTVVKNFDYDFDGKTVFECIVKPKNPEDVRVNTKVNIYDWWNVNLVKNVSSEKEDYSNQIPEKIIGNIIKTTANDEVIFDAFMGSGTTLAVASKLGFKYIGCDISKKAFEITKQRLNKIENNLFQ